MTSRHIVLDANILIRAVLGFRVAELLALHGDKTAYFTPESAFSEASRHLPLIAHKRRVNPGPLLESLNRLSAVVESLPAEVINPLADVALARIRARDPEDWPVIAAALLLDCPIWTEDRDFFGTGVPTWTTDRVELYLRGE